MIIMKCLLILFFSIYLSKGHSQQNDYKRLIDSAISLKIKYIIEFSTNIEQRNTLLNDIYLMDNNESPYIYSSTNYGIQFKTIDIKSSKSKKILKKGIKAWKVFPILKDNKFTIKVIYFRVFYKNNSCYFVHNGGTQVVFLYSCEEKKWVQSEFKNPRD